MEQSQVLKAILNVKQHTSNLKKTVTKVTKQSFSKNAIDQGSYKQFKEDQVLIRHPNSSKISSFHQIKQQNRSKQMSGQQKGLVSSYRSKNNKYQQTTLSKINSKKLNRFSDVQDIEDDSLKKISFHVQKQQTFTQKQKSRDNFYTPKINIHEGIKVIKKGRSKLELNDENEQIINNLRNQILQLQHQRDYLVSQLHQYKMALIKIRNKYLEQQSIVQAQINNKKLIDILKAQLQEEKIQNKKILQRVRISQNFIHKIRNDLLQYLKRINEAQNQNSNQIYSLEYQNNTLRQILRLSSVQLNKEKIVNKNQQNIQNEFQKEIELLKINKNKVSAQEYLLKKLQQLQLIEKANSTIKQEKKTFSFNFGFPINNKSDERDIYEDQAYLKGIQKKNTQTSLNSTQ